MTAPNYETLLSEMAEKYRSLTGHSPNDASDIGIRLKVLATQLEKLWQRLEFLTQQAFPETAQQHYLDLHANQRGIFRKEGSCAVGTLRFLRQSASTHDIIIPKGRICQTQANPPIRFETTQEVVMAAGALYADCPATAVEAGSNANVAKDAVVVMVNPPQGISAVTNPAPFTGGTDAEQDAQLRNRLLDSYRYVSNGANVAYYRAEALGFSGVSTVAVLPTRRGAGTVDIVVYGEGGNPSSQLLNQLQSHFDKVREIGVDAKVLAAQESLCNLAIEISPQTGMRTADLIPEAQEAIRSYINTLQVGQPLYLAVLIGLLLEVEGVANCKITAPTADQHILADQILRCGTITVQEMAVV